jgi:2-phosphosulfolactate phosphatase
MSSIRVEFEWGTNGVHHLSEFCDALIIIDVLSFSTCVDIAVSRGAVVYPYRWKDESAKIFAQERHAKLALGRNDNPEFSLSPQTMYNLNVGDALVLASPNGSELSLMQGNIPVYTACLRNADAVAKYIQTQSKRIGVIAAGERWSDNSLRPAIEDLMGAGAVIASIQGTLSSEAAVAAHAYLDAREQIDEMILKSMSGQELIDRGYDKDVHLACEVNVSEAVPLLSDKQYYRNARSNVVEL